MQMQLSDAERTLLAQLLDTALRALRDEIYKTDDHDYKAALRHRERVLAELIAKLERLGGP